MCDNGNESETLDDVYAGKPANVDFTKLEYVLSVRLWPPIEDYRHMVTEFSCRDLSFESDVQAAFAGLISKPTPQFKDGFYYCLSEMFFHANLPWQPRQRLRPVNASKEIHAEPSFLRSWSWMGWCCALSPARWTPEEGYLKGV
jgi:hypothetical protein